MDVDDMDDFEKNYIISLLEPFFPVIHQCIQLGFLDENFLEEFVYAHFELFCWCQNRLQYRLQKGDGEQKGDKMDDIWLDDKWFDILNKYRLYREYN